MRHRIGSTLTDEGKGLDNNTQTDLLLQMEEDYSLIGQTPPKNNQADLGELRSWTRILPSSKDKNIHATIDTNKVSRKDAIPSPKQPTIPENHNSSQKKRLTSAFIGSIKEEHLKSQQSPKLITLKTDVSERGQNALSMNKEMKDSIMMRINKRTGSFKASFTKNGSVDSKRSSYHANHFQTSPRDSFHLTSPELVASRSNSALKVHLQNLQILEMGINCTTAKPNQDFQEHGSQTPLSYLIRKSAQPSITQEKRGGGGHFGQSFLLSSMQRPHLTKRPQTQESLAQLASKAINRPQRQAHLGVESTVQRHIFEEYLKPLASPPPKSRLQTIPSDTAAVLNKNRFFVGKIRRAIATNTQPLYLPLRDWESLKLNRGYISPRIGTQVGK